LNPIENIWSRLKRAINNCDKIPKTQKELLIVIREEWAHINVKDFNGMIASMPDRMEACIKAGGGHTKW
jgi:hypothetical protein